jgi:hypothetical protein
MLPIDEGKAMERARRHFHIRVRLRGSTAHIGGDVWAAGPGEAVGAFLAERYGERLLDEWHELRVEELP